jgi:hypothetical protein
MDVKRERERHIPCGEDEEGSKEETIKKGEEPHCLFFSLALADYVVVVVEREIDRERERGKEEETNG